MQIRGTGRFGTWGNCIVQVWSGPPELEPVRVLTELTTATSAEYGMVTYVLLLEEGAVLVDAQQRRMVEAFYAEHGRLCAGLAQIVEGGNLWAVTARSIMTAVQLVQRRDYPLRVFSKREEGLRWLFPYVTPPAEGARDEAALRALVESVYAYKRA